MIIATAAISDQIATLQVDVYTKRRTMDNGSLISYNTAASALPDIYTHGA